MMPSIKFTLDVRAVGSAVFLTFRGIGSIRRLDESFSEYPRGVVGVVSAGGSGYTDSIPENPS